MKEVYNNERRRGLITVLSIIAVLLIGVGIFFYYSFFKQTKSELIEAVPTDVLFLYEVNDNASFSKDISPLLPYFNELFAMDALPAFETVHNALPANQYAITISGHPLETGAVLLFNAHIEKNDFRRLLKALSIDPANCEKFEQQKIYTYGTNFQKLYFVFFNHILSISPNKDLLKKAVIQHLHPKNLLSVTEFKQLYDIAEKNKKQNWLFMNNASYSNILNDYFTPDVNSKFQEIKKLSSWAAFQIRFSQNEILLSGYATLKDGQLGPIKKINTDCDIPDNIMPYHTCWYHKLELQEYDVCHLAIPGDSTTIYPFLMVRRDTIGNTFSPFLNAQQAEDLKTAYPNGIFPVTDSILVPKGSMFDTNHYTHFTVKGNSYVYATSPESIAAFNRDFAANGTLDGNRYYKFSKSNTASNNILEYTYYNAQDKKPLSAKLTEKGKRSNFGQNLLIFSLSVSDISDEYASVNLYLNFVK